jgi:hypothetical protein
MGSEAGEVGRISPGNGRREVWKESPAYGQTLKQSPNSVIANFPAGEIGQARTIFFTASLGIGWQVSEARAQLPGTLCRTWV